MTDETTWFRALSGPLSRDTFWRLDLGNKAIPSADDLTHIIKHLKLTRGFMREDDPRIRSPRRSPAVSKESLHTETAQPVQTLSPVSESAGAGPVCETCNDKGCAVEMVTAPFAGPDKPPYAKPMTVFCKCPAGEKAAKEMIPQIATPTDDGLDIPAGLDRRGK